MAVSADEDLAVGDRRRGKNAGREDERDSGLGEWCHLPGTGDRHPGQGLRDPGTLASGLCARYRLGVDGGRLGGVDQQLALNIR